jgi:hypothetical protein
MSSTRPTHSAQQPSSDHLSSQLSLYSFAAAAAGVSILALAIPAEGEVVITRKTIPIPLSLFGVVSVGISLANNGIDDFNFTLRSGNTARSTGALLSLRVNNEGDGRGVVGFSRTNTYSAGFRYASALMRGAKIGPSENFVSSSSSRFGDRIEASYPPSHPRGRRLFGKWGGTPKNRYVGVRFWIKGETHFGWIRLSVNTDIPHNMSATITGYAYETVPNKPIFAGTAERSPVRSQADDSLHSPGGPSLGMLASGVNGLPIWRRKENMF